MSRALRSIGFGLACLALLHSVEQASADADKALGVLGWKELQFEQKLPNRFRANPGGGIDIVSEGSVSLLQKPLSVDIQTRELLRWRWWVGEPAPSTNLSTKGADDRSLAVYVTFPFVEETASAFERIERKIVEAQAGKTAPGRVLVYVFGGDKDRGTLIDSPYLGDSGVMKILRPENSPSGQWFTETINIAEDYRQAFGSEAPNPLHIAVSADTDDTNSASRGVITDLEFIKAAKAAF